MKRSILFLVCILIAAALPVAVSAQEFEIEGGWTAYAPTRLPDYSLREHQNPGSSGELSLGEVTFGGDGGLQSDFLDYTNWETADGFLVLSDADDRQSFFAVRELTADVLVLVNLTVTEQNRRIINIRVHRPDSLMLIRT